tara:strand:- start:62 stop:1717 length:1656 start_codon:yes stop_codon:yes gene_type:complete
MNLIEVQDKLRAMPIQALQQYANGSNPEVPPYIALGVIQEKQAMQQRMGMQQGAAQGEQPTVKEKVEQSAGLMGLMQGKQQQAAQQQASASARAPGPVPSNVRPAENQPEPTAMRRGGLIGLPSNLNLASGGIVAFQKGGPTMAERLSDPKIRQLLEQLRKAGVPEDRIAQAIAQQLKAPETDEQFRQSEAARIDDGNRSPRSADIPLESIDPAVRSLIESARVSETYPDESSRGSAAAFTGEGPGAPKRPPVDGQTRSMTAPAPAPVAAPPKGLPALNTPKPAAPAQKMMMDLLGEKPKEMSMKDFLAQQTKIREAAGTNKTYGKKTSEGIDALQKQYEENRPTEMQDNIRMFSRAAQSKNGSGFAPAYLQGIDERRAADQNMSRGLLNARAGLESGERTENLARENALGTGFGNAQKRFSDEKQNRLTNVTAASGQEVDQARSELSARVQMYGADRSYEAAMMQLNSANTRADAAEKKAVIAALKIQVESAAKELKEIPSYVSDPDMKKRRADLQKQIDGYRRALDEAAGVKISDDTVLDFDADGNPIK